MTLKEIQKLMEEIGHLERENSRLDKLVIYYSGIFSEQSKSLKERDQELQRLRKILDTNGIDHYQEVDEGEDLEGEEE